MVFFLSFHIFFRNNKFVFIKNAKPLQKIPCLKERIRCVIFKNCAVSDAERIREICDQSLLFLSNYSSSLFYCFLFTSVIAFWRIAGATRVRDLHSRFVFVIHGWMLVLCWIDFLSGAMWWVKQQARRVLWRRCDPAVMLLFCCFQIANTNSPVHKCLQAIIIRPFFGYALARDL